MGKKKHQSLTERIAALINRVGEKPEPTFGDIKSELVECLGLAETLQDGAAIRDAESKVEALEAALEESNTELGKLQGEMKSLNAEVEAFRAEREKRSESEQEINPIQLKILKCLPSEHGGIRLRMDEIASAVNIPVDETEIHVERLRRAGLVGPQESEILGNFWFRSKDGNELVFAKRLAGEADQEARKYPDLPQVQELALMVIASDVDGIEEQEIARRLEKTAAAIRYNLRLLREAEMATDATEPGEYIVATYEADDTPYSPTWRILPKGEEYLAERDLL